MSSRKYKFWLILKIIHNKPKICNAHVPTCVFHLLVCLSNPDCWVCLPLVILLNTIKSRKIFLLALARPGGPEKKAVKWVWCGGVCVSCHPHCLVPPCLPLFTIHIMLLTSNDIHSSDLILRIKQRVLHKLF